MTLPLLIALGTSLDVSLVSGQTLTGSICLKFSTSVTQSEIHLLALTFLFKMQILLHG